MMAKITQMLRIARARWFWRVAMEQIEGPYIMPVTSSVDLDNRLFSQSVRRSNDPETEGIIARF